MHKVKTAHGFLGGQIPTRWRWPFGKHDWTQPINIWTEIHADQNKSPGIATGSQTCHHSFRQQIILHRVDEKDRSHWESFDIFWTILSSFSTFGHVDSQPALRSFLVFTGHVVTGSTHGLNHLVQRNAILAILP